MRTANPALNQKVFEGFDATALGEERMTLQGTVNKAGIMIVLVLLGAVYTWNIYYTAPTAEQAVANSFPWLVGGMIGGFVLGLVTVFKKTWSVFTAPLYALLQGLFLGAISSVMEAKYPGIVIQAVALTFGTLVCLLAAYTSGLIKPSENFKLGITAATGAIALIYVVTMAMGFFGIQMPYIHESNLVGIAFSVFVVIVAALNLVLDFDFIEQGAEQGAPKYMEWYSAFGLMVTLIWLYLEILRLLAKSRGRK